MQPKSWDGHCIILECSSPIGNQHIWKTGADKTGMLLVQKMTWGQEFMCNRSPGMEHSPRLNGQVHLRTSMFKKMGMSKVLHAAHKTVVGQACFVVTTPLHQTLHH